MLPLFREANDERNAGPRIVDVALSPRECSAVIGVVEHDRILRLTQFFQLPQLIPYPPVHQEEIVEVAGPVFPQHRGVRVVGWEHNLPGRNDSPGRVLLPPPVIGLVRGLPLVGKRGIEDRKEGLSLPAIPVVRLATALVPAHVLPASTLSIDRHVIVGLGVIGAVVSCFPEELRIIDDRPGHGYTAAVIVNTEGRGIHPRNERGAGRRANRGRGEGVEIPHSLFRKPVEVRGPRLDVPVASKIRAVVLTRDPKDIGTVRTGRRQKRREPHGS